MGLESLGGVNLPQEIKNLPSNIDVGNNIESAESDISLYDKTEQKSVDPKKFNGTGKNNLMDYRKYCDACRNAGQQPVSRREFEEANGRDLQDYKPEVEEQKTADSPKEAEKPKAVNPREVSFGDEEEVEPEEEEEEDQVGFEMDLDG